MEKEIEKFLKSEGLNKEKEIKHYTSIINDFINQIEDNGYTIIRIPVLNDLEIEYIPIVSRNIGSNL